MFDFKALQETTAVAESVASESAFHPHIPPTDLIGGGPVIRCPAFRSSRSFAPGRRLFQQESVRPHQSCDAFARSQSKQQGVCSRRWA